MGEEVRDAVDQQLVVRRDIPRTEISVEVHDEDDRNAAHHLELPETPMAVHRS